jgi:cysteine desulfurase
MSQPIYLDHAATTPILPEAREAMLRVLAEAPGNPASAHAAGRRGRQILEDAREHIGSLLNAEPSEVIFTSGATEANNLAIFGLAGDPPGHILASPIEHPCVVEPLRQLAARGFDVEYLPVTREGIVEVGAIASRMQPETRLVTIQSVNHETGAIQPVSQSTIRNPQSAIHTDAAQAVGKIAVNFRSLGVTAMTVSAHKFGGPVGVGALLLRRGAKLRPQILGGHQQQGRRPGTEPVALAAGMAAALEVAIKNLEHNQSRVAQSRQRFLDRLSAIIGPVEVNSDGVPHILSVSIPSCAADRLLIALDLAGVACSTGSACSSGSLLPSPVLQAMGLTEERLRSAMRFSFSSGMTIPEVERAAERIGQTVERMRATEPMPSSASF